MSDDEKRIEEMFYLERIYPDAKSVFTSKTERITDIKDNCIVVLDTNVLLVPYLTGQRALGEIRTIYERLVREGRLFLPARVVREFAGHRATKIGEVYQQLSRKRNEAGRFTLERYPLLEGLNEYDSLEELVNDYNAQAKKLRGGIAAVLDRIQQWNWDDPVSMIYSEIFTPEIILEAKVDSEKLVAELDWRWTHKLPPGYKDASKRDEGVGDLLIWKTIVQLGLERNEHLIFVTGEEKPDWWHRSEKQPLYPRFELYDEYRRATNGSSFHILKFSQMLDLFGAGDEIVKEVEQKEEVSIIRERPKRSSKLTAKAAEAVREWLQQQYSPDIIMEAATPTTRVTDAEYALIFHDASRLRASVHAIDSETHAARRLRELHMIRSMAINDEEDVFAIDYELICVVANSNRHATILSRIPLPDIATQRNNLQVVIGYIDSENRYRTVEEPKPLI